MATSTGMADQNSQRAAGKFAEEEKREVPSQTGICNLMQDEVTASLHIGADRPQTWQLVRFLAPAQEN